MDNRPWKKQVTIQSLTTVATPSSATHPEKSLSSPPLAAAEDPPVALPGVKSFADGAPYPRGHPLAETRFDQSWKTALQSSSSSQRRNCAGEAPEGPRTQRAAGDVSWEDASMAEWDPDDFRLFVSNISHDISTEMLADKFARYPSFLRARVVVDRRGKPRGYGFVSFSDAEDYMKAFHEMNGKYLGSRAIHLEKSSWKERDAHLRLEKDAKKPSWLK